VPKNRDFAPHTHTGVLKIKLDKVGERCYNKGKRRKTWKI
jgi:hypothetical protein